MDNHLVSYEINVYNDRINDILEVNLKVRLRHMELDRNEATI